MQKEWGTENPARFFAISMLFAVVSTPLPFIPSPRADLFSAAARLGARGEGTGTRRSLPPAPRMPSASLQPPGSQSALMSSVSRARFGAPSLATLIMARPSSSVVVMDRGNSLFKIGRSGALAE
jgi:hypothetical protein